MQKGKVRQLTKFEGIRESVVAVGFTAIFVRHSSPRAHYAFLSSTRDILQVFNACLL